MDKNNDGFISKAEFSNLAKTLPKDKVWSTYVHIFNIIYNLKVDAVMAKFDEDGDGKLDYEEFKKMIQKKKK